MKYEYKVSYLVTDKAETQLNNWGKAGWELVQLGPINGLNREAVFKREVK